MRNALLQLLAAVGLSLLTATPAMAQPSLWTVDDDNPADFDDLQTAFDSAAPGDVLQLAPGSYVGPFSVDKGLTVLTAPGASMHTTATVGPSEPTLLVHDLPAGESFVYSGGLIFNNNGNAPAAIHVRDCDGPVWLQGLFVDSYGAEALHVTDSASVVLNGTRLQTNLTPAAPDGTPQPGAGARLDGGALHLHDSDLSGTHGVFQMPGLPAPDTATAGGPGLAVADGSLRMLGGSARGNSGSSLMLQGCQLGGDGGDGVELLIGAGSPVALLRDTDVSGGSPGLFDSGCAPASMPGLDVDASGGAALIDATPARQLEAPGQVQAGETLTLGVDAQPGDLLWFFSALAPGVGVPAGGLTMHLDTTSLTQLLLLPAPASGQLSLPLVVPELPPGFEVLPVPLQVFALDDQGGRHETGPLLIVVL